MKKKLQIFVSSTYKDLRNERQAAVEAILEAGHIPAGMELFAAGDKSQLETIRKWINDSDIFMLILGGRYGSIEPETSLSYIELEYQYAHEKNIPLFAVVINEEAIRHRIINSPEDIEFENPGKLKAFRASVLSKMSSFFSDTKDVKLAIYKSISQYIDEREFVGWISGSHAKSEEELQRTIEMQEYINKLEKEVETLKKAVSISTLAQDNDIVPLDFSVKDFIPTKDITWDDLFIVIANQCLEGKASLHEEYYIKEAVAGYIGTVIELQNRLLILEDKLFNDNFNKIKIQFLALDYIQIDSRQYTPKNILGSFWSLTKSGKNHLIDTMAIRKVGKTFPQLEVSSSRNL